MNVGKLHSVRVCVGVCVVRRPQNKKIIIKSYIGRLRSRGFMLTLVELASLVIVAAMLLPPWVL